MVVNEIHCNTFLLSQLKCLFKHILIIKLVKLEINQLMMQTIRESRLIYTIVIR